MILGNLELQNFRRFQASGWELGRVTLFTGPNETGKTTVLDSLEFLFSGLTRTTERNGSGRDDLIRAGAKRAVVTVTNQDGAMVTRTIPHGLTMSWRPNLDNVSSAQAELERAVGCSSRDAALTLRANRYWSLSGQDQKGLLFDVLGLQIRPEDIREALAAEEERYLKRPLVDTALEVMGQIPADLDYAKRACYAARTEVNRQNKAAKTRLEEAKREAEGIPPATAPDPADLANAQADYDRAHVALVERDAHHRQRAEVEADLATTRQELEQLGAQQVEIPAGDPAALQREAQKYQAAVSGLRRKQETLAREREARYAFLRTKKTHAERQATTLKQQLELGRCQTCQQVLTEGPAREALEAAIAALSREAFECWEELNSPDPTAADRRNLEERIGKGSTILKNLEEQIAAIHYARHQVEQRDLGLVQARKRLARLEERLANLPAVDSQADGDPLQQQFEAARQRRADLAAQKDAADAYLRITERTRALADEVAETKARSEVLSTLVDFFGPEGFQLKVLAQRLDPIQGHLNRILATWGMEVRYLYPLLQMEVRPRGSETWIPWHLLSDSSQLCVALAHQAMFAQQTGLRILGLDRLEAFDADRQAQLLQACLDLVERDEVDHVILTGVTLLAPVPEGVRHYTLTQEAA